ncbi:MAG: hypothetical protein K6A28_04280 [Bacteroidales bacterium]|nr:hypothetical protein [Bacteroidales bacterium]
MKRLFLTLVALLLVSAAFSQTATIPISAKTNKICFQKVVPTEGTTTEVFNRIAGEWLRSAYKNPMAVVTGNDGSTITGKHNIQIDCEDEVKTKCPVVNYKFTVEVREGRIRYTITDFTLNSKSRFPIERWLDKEDPQYDPAWAGYLDQIAAFAEAWGKNLEEKLIPEQRVEEEEW